MLDLKNIPNQPGCYLFKNKKGNIIYIGKAKNIKKRVKSYFQKTDHDLKTKSMIRHIDIIEFFVTDNELESLILEDKLIKKNQPKYNIRLKDAKAHSYIQITDEKYPRAIIARRKTGKGKFFGPFVTAAERNYILQFIKSTFLLRTCKRLPKKPCLRFQIKLCDAPCINNISIEEYKNRIKDVKLVLNGNINKLIKKMKIEMQTCSKKQDFEKAFDNLEWYFVDYCSRRFNFGDPIRHFIAI